MIVSFVSASSCRSLLAAVPRLSLTCLFRVLFGRICQTTDILSFAPTPAELPTWHHYCVTYQQVSSALPCALHVLLLMSCVVVVQGTRQRLLYRDGTVVVSQTTQFDLTASGPLVIGALRLSGTSPFSGGLGEWPTAMLCQI